MNCGMHRHSITLHRALVIVSALSAIPSSIPERRIDQYFIILYFIYLYFIVACFRPANYSPADFPLS